MASTETLTLYPAADSSLKHSCSAGSEGFSLINEETADDDATYIYHDVNTTSSKTITSTFKIVGSNTGKIQITSLEIHARAMANYSSILGDTHTLTLTASIDGTSLGSGSASYVSNSYSDINATFEISSNKDLAGKEYSSLSAVNIILSMATAGAYSSRKGSAFQIRITQLYVIITYTKVTDETETGMYLKTNGVYNLCAGVYQKVNGVWVQLTHDEMKNIFKVSERYKHMT